MNVNQEIPQMNSSSQSQRKTITKIRRKNLYQNKILAADLDESSEEYYERMRAVKKNLYKNSIQAFLTYISDSKPQIQMYLQKYFIEKQIPIPKSFSLTNFVNKFPKQKHRISNLKNFQSFFLNQSRLKYNSTTQSEKKVKQIQSNRNKKIKQLKKKNQLESTQKMANYAKYPNEQNIKSPSKIQQFRSQFFTDKPLNQNLFQTLAVDYVLNEDCYSIEQIKTKIEIFSNYGFDFKNQKDNNNNLNTASDSSLQCKTRKNTNFPTFNSDNFYKYQSIFGINQQKSRKQQQQYYDILDKYEEKSQNSEKNKKSGKSKKSQNLKIEKQWHSTCFQIQQEQQQQQQQQQEQNISQEQQQQSLLNQQQQNQNGVLSVSDLEKKLLRVFSYKYLSTENLAYCVHKSRMKDYEIFLKFRHFLKAIISQQY